jgi:hypothetical protein
MYTKSCKYSRQPSMFVFQLLDTDLKDKAKEKCKEYLIDSTLPQICSKLGDSLRQYYYDACVEDIVSSLLVGYQMVM